MIQQVHMVTSHDALSAVFAVWPLVLAAEACPPADFGSPDLFPFPLAFNKSF